MNRLETIETIKQSLKSLFTKENAFAEYTLKDGMKVVCDDEEVGVGSALFGLAEDGTRVALNDGVYELQDGTKMELVGGLVKSIVETETEEEELAKTSETSNGEKPIEEKPKDEEMKVRMETLEAQVGELVSLVQEMAKAQKSMMEKMGQPAENSVKTEAKGFNGFSNDLKFNKVTKKNELDEMRKIISDKRKSDNNLNLAI